MRARAGLGQTRKAREGSRDIIRDTLVIHEAQL